MRILVVGDFISDVYTFGTATRLCPEAPVPVIVPTEWKESWGGAGLVWEQLGKLGADVQGRMLTYSKKERFFAGDHLVCRIDSDGCIPALGHKLLLFPVEAEDLEYCDAFVIADYGKGGMTYQLARQIVETGKPCFVDAKPHWPWYHGKNVTIFPNHQEATPISETPAGTFQSYEFGRVVSKLGKDGCRLNDAEHKDLTIPATVTEVVDVTGAGDVFMAGFVYAWSLQFPAGDCLRFANALAGESCRHRGTFVVGREFAQGVLDRLRASAEFRQQYPGCFPDSMLEAIEQQRGLDRIETVIANAALENNPDADSVQVFGATVDGRYTPLSGQIRRKSPSVPTPSSDVPTPERIDMEPSSKPPWEG